MVRPFSNETLPTVETEGSVAPSLRRFWGREGERGGDLRESLGEEIKKRSFEFSVVRACLSKVQYLFLFYT